MNTETALIRLLRADEIECRIATINEKGLSLLLFKDARVDQKILDETFSPMGWRRTHQEIGGNLYCTVEIWDEDKQQWIAKQDVGTESYSEKEKGQASDSFKRACFNWGIGRELYTAPFIWIPAGKVEIRQNGGKYSCYEHFSVSEIGYDKNRAICSLTIVGSKKQVLFSLYPAKTEIPDKQMAGAGRGSKRSAAESAGAKATDLTENEGMIENPATGTGADKNGKTRNKRSSEMRADESTGASRIAEPSGEKNRSTVASSRGGSGMNRVESSAVNGDSAVGATGGAAGMFPGLSLAQTADLEQELKRTGVPLQDVLERYSLTSAAQMSEEIFMSAMRALRRTSSKKQRVNQRENQNQKAA